MTDEEKKPYFDQAEELKAQLRDNDNADGSADNNAVLHHTRSLTALKDVGLICFRDLIFQEIKGQVEDAVIALIDQEREGEQIDRALLKNVLDIFVEIGLGTMDCYENDFEDFLLKDTTGYYSVKAQNWIVEDSCPDYMIKAEECLKREKERVGHYLHINTEPKLLEAFFKRWLVAELMQLLGMPEIQRSLLEQLRK